jgi:hypothetical protein
MKTIVVVVHVFEWHGQPGSCKLRAIFDIGKIES